VMTIKIAIPRVTSTSRIESPTRWWNPKAIAYSSPGGKLFESSCNAALAWRSTFERVGVGELQNADAHRIAPLNFSEEL